MRGRYEHKRNINKILRDDKLSPNKRLLATMLRELEAAIEDGNKKKELLLYDLLHNTFGTPQRIKWNAPDDSTSENPSTTKSDKSIDASLRDAFANILGERDAVDSDSPTQ